MSGIEGLSGLATRQVTTTTAVIQALRMANEQHEVVADLLEDAVEVATQVREAGQGEQLDVRA